MDELGEKCWLALAPNHMYIKAKTQHIGWYNIELTTGDFPTDAWLMASGYIHLDAVRNGIYTDTLSLTVRGTVFDRLGSRVYAQIWNRKQKIHRRLLQYDSQTLS